MYLLKKLEHFYKALSEVIIAFKMQILGQLAYIQNESQVTTAIYLLVFSLG